MDFRQIVHVPMEMSTNVPTAHCDAQNGPADIPRMTPTPAPLAIPLSKLFRAHGISPIFCTSSHSDILLMASLTSDQ